MKAATKVFGVLGVIAISVFGYKVYKINEAIALEAPFKVKHLVYQVEESLANEANIDPWVENKANFLLARAYATYGDYNKFDDARTRISQVRDRRVLIRPFIDQIVTAIRAGDHEAVLRLINTIPQYDEWMRSIQLSKDLHDPEFKFFQKEPITSTWLPVELCRVAAKRYIFEKKIPEMYEVLIQPPCREVRSILPDLIPSFLSNHSVLINPFQSLFNYERFLLEENREHLCPLSEEFKAEVGDYLLSRIQEGELIQDKYLAITLLNIIGEEVVAYEELRKTFADTATRSLALPAFNASYLRGEENKSIEIASYINMFEREPVLTGGWGGRKSRQWWVMSIPEGEVLAYKPSDLGFLLASKIKNNKARFTVLKNMFKALDPSGSQLKYPSCDASVERCIIDDLQKIAEQEENDWDRDTMYAHLSSMSELIGDHENAKNYLGKIGDLNREQCAYDMCSDKTVVFFKHRIEEQERESYQKL